MTVYGMVPGMTKRVRVSLCSVPGTDHSPGRLRGGMCDKHYRRTRKYGSPDDPRPSARERFRRLTKRSVTGCWEWQGQKTKDGYGKFKSGKRQFRAHRWAYECVYGRIPDGKEIDHKCRNRACVRPSHLRAVTHQTNINAAPRWQVTHCPRNHPYDEKNTIWRGTKRACRICQREANRASYRKKHPVVQRRPRPPKVRKLKRRKQRCVNGHQYTEENTIIRIENGRTKRACRECMREANRRAYRKRKAKVA